MESVYLFWNDPLYQPKTKLGDTFWQEFLAIAKLLHSFHGMQRPRRKNYSDDQSFDDAVYIWGTKSPTIYSVFNKLRQDMHGELPYSNRFISGIDERVTNEFRRLVDDRRSS